MPQLLTLSTHHCWSLSKSFIPSLVVWSVTQNNACGREKQNKKSNGEQSDLYDLEQVTLKPQLQAHHCLTTWLQIWFHSVLWGDSIRTGADLENQNFLIVVHPAVMGKLTSLLTVKRKLFNQFIKNTPFLHLRQSKTSFFVLSYLETQFYYREFFYLSSLIDQRNICNEKRLAFVRYAGWRN